MGYDTIVQALVVVPSGQSLFSEQATKIELEDEGAGLYVAVSQDGKDGTSRKICLDDAEWPTVRAASINRQADYLIALLRGYKSAPVEWPPCIEQERALGFAAVQP